MFQLKTYHSDRPAGSFYIQSKGLHAGRPLKRPIANCFTVFTDDDLLFDKVYSMWIGRLFEPVICGSVIPFIRKKDVKDVIEAALRNHRDVNRELATLRTIDQLICNLERQLRHCREMQKTLCRKINSSSKPQNAVPDKSQLKDFAGMIQVDDS